MRMRKSFLANEFLLSVLVALGHYMLLEMLDVFSQCAIAEQSVAPISRNSVTHSQKYLALRQTLPLPCGSSSGLWSVFEKND